MKQSHKFIAVCISFIAVFAVLSALTAYDQARSVQRSANRTVIQIIANIREQYPDVDELQIVEILNGTAPTNDTYNMLDSFGIDSYNALQVNEAYPASAAAKQLLISLLSGGAALGVFLVFVHKKKKETLLLTKFMERINKGDYAMQADSNSEDEYSLLHNEIYKTTVMLRKQNETVMRDRVMLKDALSDVSHQLKTPITSIQIMLDNIIDDPEMPPDVRNDFIADIRNSVNGISFLVQALLKLSRLEACSIEFHPRPESMSEVIKDCIRTVGIIAEVREVNLVSECPEPFTLSCDKKWLCEALCNILKNCIENTPAGGSVTISAQENAVVSVITIRDTGFGISKEELPHIFERFYKTKHSKSDSVGIGLAISLEIIKKHNGYILTESQINAGTVFTVKLFKEK